MAVPSAGSSRRQRLAALITVALALGVTAVVVLISGRGSAGGDRAGAAAPAPSVAAATAIRPGVIPPAFHATALGGATVDLAANRGKVVLLNFFATWCENCKAELPLLEQANSRLASQGLVVITVDFRDTGDVAAFLQPYHITFPAVLDPSSAIGSAYGVNDLPVSVVIGRNGRVSRVFHGQLSDHTLAELLGPLL